MTPERLACSENDRLRRGRALLAAVSKLPGVVLLLLSGSDRTFHLTVEPLDLGPVLEPVGLLVSLVLFDGGLNLRFGGAIKTTVQRIAVLRLLLSLGAGLMAAHWLAGLNSGGCRVQCHRSAAGPTVVTPLVRQMRWPPARGHSRGRGARAGADRSGAGVVAA